jgi:hypothetical protein
MIKSFFVDSCICFILFAFFAISLIWIDDVQSQDVAGVSQERLHRFEQQITMVVEKAIAEGKMPGCVVGVGNRDGLFYQKAFGNKSLDPTTPMTLDTVFDMASITKPVATATSIMQLVDRGELRLKDKVSAYFPEFAVNDKEAITVEHLLLHTRGRLAKDTRAEPICTHRDSVQVLRCELYRARQTGREDLRKVTRRVYRGKHLRAAWDGRVRVSAK